MRPERVIGDTAYGNVEVREELEQRQVEVLAPVHSSSPKDGAIPKERFHIDLDSDTVTCPEGKTTPIYKRSRHKPNVTGERVARFAREDASPARSGPTAHRASNETSGSDVVKTCDRPRSGRYPTQPSASTCIAPGQGSSGCSDSSFTATTDARAATSELKIRVTSRLDRRPGQPPPNRNRAPGPGGLRKTSPRPQQSQQRKSDLRPGLKPRPTHSTFSAVRSNSTSLDDAAALQPTGHAGGERLLPVPWERQRTLDRRQSFLGRGV